MEAGLIKYFRILASTVCVLSFSYMKAQQDAQYTQFLYNTQTYNPAFVGLQGQSSLVALYRAQWMGVEGAPKTQNLNYSTPTSMRNVSVGFGIVNDKIGPTSETYFDLDLSYTVTINTRSYMSFGLKASAHLLDVNYSILNQDFSVGKDPLLYANIDNRFSPNLGAGVLYYSDNFFIGFSIPSFLETLHFDRSSLSEAKENMHYYLTSGFVTDLTYELQFRPSIMIKAVSGAPVQTDVSATFLYRELLSLGFSYRLKAAVSGLVGYQVSDELFVGLSYDRAATSLGRDLFNSGSIEAVLRYNFGSSNSNFKPRFIF